jgi:hypothetical protein
VIILAVLVLLAWLLLHSPARAQSLPLRTMPVARLSERCGRPPLRLNL